MEDVLGDNSFFKNLLGLQVAEEGKPGRNSPLGLIRLRANHSNKVLRKECSNCHCKRYNPCGCRKA